MEKAGKNATYTSHVAVVKFVEAIGIWVEEVCLNVLTRHPTRALWLMSEQILPL